MIINLAQSSTTTVHRKMYMGLTHTCATRAFISHIPIDKLIYQIYHLVGGFPVKNVIIMY